MADCLTPAEFAGLLSGSLPPKAKARAEAHCLTCEKCSRTLKSQRANTIPLADAPPAGSSAAIQIASDTTTHGSDDDAAISAPLTTESVAGFDILSEIHRGGQGVVYKALQKATKRTVALKLLLRGQHASQQQQQRFQREVDLAASLHHPNIVTIFESGTTHTGSSYLAMEYIHGLPLDAYHAQHELTTEQTLALMHKVCTAVNYAHERGIVHRDLKPSNILVDADGEPHILDFGLAKGAGADLYGGQRVTVTGEFLGTLAYASPEQAAREPQRVDTRTDVYSLGMTLYHLLTGEYAYPVQGHVGEVLQHITQTEPRKPSLLRPGLDRDIDTIVLKALAKERDRRYPSAGTLANDIARFLAGKPIQARQDHLFYVATKQATRWTARNEKIALALAVTASVALALSIGTSLVFRWTPIGQWCERALVSRTATPASAAAFDQVRLIAITDKTNFEALAQSQNLAGVRAEALKSWRRVHGSLMEHLVGGKPRVVVWDIAFRGETSFDGDFVRGVQALGRIGVPVVTGVRGWWFDESSVPKLSRNIARHVEWGCLNASFSRKGPWAVELVARRGQHRPLQSLALAAAALSRHPDASFEIRLDTAKELTTVQYARPNPELPKAAVMLEGVDTFPIRVKVENRDWPEFGLKAGDVVGRFGFSVPPDPVLAGSTIEYADIFGASETKLQEWFKDRVVVIGNRRSDNPDRYFHPDGRKLSGCDGQATAIHKALDGLRRPTKQSSVTLQLSILSGSALFGLIIGLVAAHSRMRRSLVLLAFAAVFVLVSVLAATWHHWIWFPMVPFLALFFSSELCSAVHRVRLRRASWNT